MTELLTQKPGECPGALVVDPRRLVYAIFEAQCREIYIVEALRYGNRITRGGLVLTCLSTCEEEPANFGLRRIDMTV